MSLAKGGWSAPLVCLTDEELVLLNAVHPAVLQPYLETVPVESRPLALAGAYRALRAHGLEAGPGGEGLAVPDGLVQLLHARECADAVLMVTATGQQGESVCYAHLCPPAIVLEQLAPDGIHSFRVAQVEHAAHALREVVVAAEHVTGRIWRPGGEPAPTCEHPVDLAVGDRLLRFLLDAAGLC